MTRLHVCPVDGIAHETIGLECVCQPEVVSHGKTELVFHNHLDGKEEHEWLVQETFKLTKEGK